MKKTILALAVASTAVAAQADNTTLYGDVKGTYDHKSETGSKATSKFSTGGKFGIKGSEDLGNGLSAVYKMEVGVGSKAETYAVKKDAKGNDVFEKTETTSGLKTKKLYVGLKGGFGELTVGNQSLPNSDLGEYSDPFNALTPNATRKNSQGFKSDDVFFDAASNSLVYKTTEMSGFQAGVAVIADGEASRISRQNHVDAFQVTAKYHANGIFAGLGYSKVRSSDDAKNAGLEDLKLVNAGLGYGNDQFEVGVKFDRAKQDSNRLTRVRLAGKYNIDTANSVYAGYGQTKFKSNSGSAKSKAFSLGFNHAFSKRTNAWAEFGYTKDKASDAKTKAISLGIKTKF